jgi:hypothetical protein
MKKGILLALSSFMMINAHAESWCGYKDYFHLSDNSHPAIYVVSGYSDSDLFLEFVGPRSFVIRDTYQCRSGYAHVTVAYDSANWCVLDIKDGPYKNHPTINASCNGMKYLGTDYDGIGSSSYSIKLD